MNITYSQHKISDKHDTPFSESEYSKFKFGDNALAEKFGNELFDGFIARHRDLILAHNEVVILPSPYFAIPTASNFLTFHFKDRMNEFLYAHGRKALAESKIYRNQTYTTDYGTLDFAERLKLIANDTYYIDRDYIKGKLCLFLDDIKITGSHEHIVKKILNEHDVQGEFVFVYFAELVNKDIHPNIENYYNYFYVKDAQSLARVMNGAAFVLNTRTVKYILKLDNAELQILMRQVQAPLWQDLFRLAVSNNYHTIPDYSDNLTHIYKTITAIKTTTYGYQLTEGPARNA